jgi:Fe-S cluster biogenesis protein NfuA
MFIQTEDTPNPNALKFFPGVDVSLERLVHFNNLTEARAESSLASKLFQVENVEAVFLGKDFITVTKSTDSSWNVIKPEALMIIMDHFVAGLPVFDNHSTKRIEQNLEGLSEIEKQIVEIIETRVRPSVAMDGGDIVYRGFENGIVKLELRGACSGCPSSIVTLKNGIESMLQHYIPEVEAVEAVNEEHE